MPFFVIYCYELSLQTLQRHLVICINRVKYTIQQIGFADGPSYFVDGRVDQIGRSYARKLIFLKMKVGALNQRDLVAVN